MSVSWVELDGSHGEGGGQILRSSLTLSLLTGIPFRLHKIRAGRPKQGLQAQHLASVRAAAAIGGATVKGDQLGSRELSFEPGQVIAGKYHFSIGTAGATGLVLQTIYLPLALRGDSASEVTITGGTHTKASPCFHFLQLTWKGYLQRMGLGLELTMHRTGFYPRGGGVIQALIPPAPAVRAFEPLTGNQVSLRNLVSIKGFSAVAGLPQSIAEQQANRAMTRLRQNRLSCELAIENWPGGPGTVVGLVLDTTPVPALFYGLGERGKPAERVADEAVDALLVHYQTAPESVDPHSADQIVLPLAFAVGHSRYPVSCVTPHLLTNIHVIRQFVARAVTCEGTEGEPGRVIIS